MVNVWWQGNLSTLIGRFPVLYPIEKETIIQEHTLLPLFAVFMEKTRADEMIENAINQDEQRVLLRSVVGVQGNMDKYLYYCPCCVTQDIDRYGESYWHRIHQIPGVLVCPQHGEQLIKYEIKRSYEHIIGLRDINLLDKVIDKSEPQKQWSERIHTTLFEIAKDFQYLLSSEFQSKKNDFFYKQYRGFLIERQLIFPSGIINRKKLIQEFETFFGTDVLDNFGLNFYGFLIRVLQQGRGTFPPIFHVMLMRFFAGSVEKFVKASTSNSFYGGGPWYCLNPVSEHFKQRTVTTIKLAYSGFARQSLAILHCEQCGFTYSYLGVPQSKEEEQTYHRVVEFGPVWENQLRYMIQNKVNLNTMSQKLGVQPRKLKQVAESLGLETDWKPSGNSYREKVFEKKRNEYRKEWLKLRDSNSHLSRTELKELDIRVSSWLIRNDGAWFDSNSPKKKSLYRKDLKQDWKRRDEELLKTIKGIVLNWNDIDKPVRITRKKIFDLVGNRYPFYNRLNKLKKSKAYIESVAESVEDFQIRKVKWAINTLREEDKLVTENRVLRKIYLLGKDNVSERVMNAIKEGI
jgi:hypothetical protein